MAVYSQFNEELRNLWPKTIMPFSTFEWHKTWFEHFGKGEQLAIIAHGDAVVPLAIHDGIAHFTGGEEIADYLDAVGPVDWNYVQKVLRECGATKLMLRNIPEGSPTLSHFSHELEDTTPILKLPDSFDGYVNALGRKERHELRRKMRRFEEEHQNIRMEEYEDMELLLTLMGKNNEKKAFLTPLMKDFFRKLPSVAPIRQFVLFVNGNPVATTLAFEIEQSLLLYNSGYSVEGSGFLLKTKIIEWAIQNNYTSLNFLQGNERYKYDLGAVDFSVYRVTLPI